MTTAAKKYSVIKAPAFAFFAGDFYRDVAENWQGTGCLYLLGLLTLCWTVTTVTLSLPIVNWAFNKDTQSYIAQLPKMKLADGKMSIDKPTPYFLKDPSNGENVAVFRTEPGSKVEDSDPAIVITQTAIEAHSGSNIQPISDFQSMSVAAPSIEIDSAGVKQAVETTAIAIPIFTFCFGLPSALLGCFILAAIYGGIGMLIANGSMQKELTFETCLRLTNVAMTPAIIISTILAASGLLPLQNLLIYIVVFFPLVIGYSIFGLFNAPAQSPGTSPS
jgi:hypothetical protein